jgi:hypothetical protein
VDPSHEADDMDDTVPDNGPDVQVPSLPDRISGGQREELVAALADAFPSFGGLTQLASYCLDVELAEVAPQSNLREAAFGLVRWAEAHGHLIDLVSCAANQNPGNPELRSWIDSVSSNPVAPTPPARHMIDAAPPRDGKQSPPHKRKRGCGITVTLGITLGLVATLLVFLVPFVAVRPGPPPSPTPSVAPFSTPAPSATPRRTRIPFLPSTFSVIPFATDPAFGAPAPSPR